MTLRSLDKTNGSERNFSSQELSTEDFEIAKQLLHMLRVAISTNYYGEIVRNLEKPSELVRGEGVDNRDIMGTILSSAIPPIQELKYIAIKYPDILPLDVINRASLNLSKIILGTLKNSRDVKVEDDDEELSEVIERILESNQDIKVNDEEDELSKVTKIFAKGSKSIEVNSDEISKVTEEIKEILNEVESAVSEVFDYMNSPEDSVKNRQDSVPPAPEHPTTPEMRP
jgi:hypothetical protein